MPHLSPKNSRVLYDTPTHAFRMTHQLTCVSYDTQTHAFRMTHQLTCVVDTFEGRAGQGRYVPRWCLRPAKYVVPGGVAVGT